MKTIKQLTPDELQKLYDEVVIMREKVLTFVQAYESMDANKLVSKTFQREIEQDFFIIEHLFYKILKRLAGNIVTTHDGDQS